MKKYIIAIVLVFGLILDIHAFSSEEKIERYRTIELKNAWERRFSRGIDPRMTSHDPKTIYMKRKYAYTNYEKNQVPLEYMLKISKYATVE